MPFKNYVQTSKDDWSTNACVYATEQEALDAGHELSMRWCAVSDYEARPCTDEVNYFFDDGRNQKIDA